MNPPGEPAERWRRVRRPFSGRARIWAPVVLGGLVVALLSGVTILVEVTSTDSDDATDGGDGPAVLHRAAAALESDRPDAIRIPGADQWMYRKKVSNFVVDGERVSELWISVDDAGKRATRDAGGQIEVRTEHLEGGPSSSPLYDNIRGLYQLYDELPEETDQLVQAIYDLTDQKFRAYCRDTGDSCPAPEDRNATVRDQAAFDLALTLLGSGAPPDAQAGIYRALKFPGVEDDGMVKDAMGRAAIAIGCDQGAADGINTRRQILLDPDTYTYRGNRVLDHDIKYGGPLLQSTAVVDWGIVDQPDQLP